MTGAAYKYMDILGIPYAPNGDSPQTGFNCYTFIKYFRKRFFDLDTPVAGAFDVRNPIQVVDTTQAATFYEKTDAPQNGDIVLMYKGKKPAHVGVFVDGLVMHCDGTVYTNSGVKMNSMDAIGRVYCKIEFYTGPNLNGESQTI